MTVEGLARVQARIAAIQQRFTPPPVTVGTAESASTAATASAAGTASTATTDFASLLAGATTAVTPGTTARPATVGAGTQTFLDAALRQAGDPYVWGATASPTDPDPDAFDCSELTKWAATQAGVDLPDGSWLQYLELEKQGALVPVEQAVRTPGALLFSFSSQPRAGGSRPDQAHVAISLGDGRTIEARGTEYGVGSFEAGDRFEYGAVIPGL